MGKHYKNPIFTTVGEQVAEAVAAELVAQPWWLRYKGTIMLVLQALAWVAGVAPVYLADAPEWTALLVGGIGFFVTTLVNRLTVDGVTPSMAPRLAEQAEATQAEQAPPTLPVYTGPTTAAE
ncbi:hypothetical protein [Corynebacterium aurimucosum]|uniref:Putative membrane protein n=1 Tax=Corynebacterium aurimucosum (strain ATCC 700975 / DSM 44827 / CIP 107346 / CN-1) TaxID=548476 RepID=C3PIB0_CORA7|nr:hypothetical protein [Corynebacterium aurimucosum]ACP33564.1 putative membrane protein [Corynebacterium aurimucosum ATCC 700975]QQU92323.1 hypothetical protein I6I67_08740 [Corynebacterium aurimucosum]